VFALACKSPPSTDSPSSAADSSSAELPGAGAAASQIPADSTCLFDTTASHPSARELLDEFLRRDAEGEFLRSSEWYGGAFTCPGHAPGWDEATLILAYHVTRLQETDTSSSFEVRYEEAGALTQDEHGFLLEEEQQIAADTFRLLKTRYGWRIDSPIQHQRILSQTALNLPRLNADSRLRITELLRRPQSPDTLVLSRETTFPADLTADELTQRFGAANVVHDSLYLGEGMFEPGTIVFPSDSSRSVEVLWKDARARQAPRIIHVTAQQSKWRSANGLRIGIDLHSTEQLNGRAFCIAGFGFDGSGTVTSWDGQLSSPSNAPSRASTTFLRVYRPVSDTVRLWETGSFHPVIPRCRR
jgi:hypothetical protein